PVEAIQHAGLCRRILGHGHVVPGAHLADVPDPPDPAAPNRAATVRSWEEIGARQAKACPTTCNSFACRGGACFSLPTPACGRISSHVLRERLGKCRNSGTAGRRMITGGIRKSSRMSGLERRMDLALGLRHANERK